MLGPAPILHNISMGSRNRQRNEIIRRVNKAAFSEGEDCGFNVWIGVSYRAAPSTYRFLFGATALFADCPTTRSFCHHIRVVERTCFKFHSDRSYCTGRVKRNAGFSNVGVGLCLLVLC